MRSFVWLLVVSSLVLNAPNLNASGNEHVAPSNRRAAQPHPSEQKKQPKTEQQKTDKAPLAFEQTDQAKHSNHEPTESDPQMKDETPSEAIARRALYANWFQGIALIVTICVMAFIAIRELRAYVFVDSEDEALVEHNGEIRIMMVIKNTGKTPAFKLNYWIEANVLPYPLEGKPMPSIGDPARTRSIYLPPGHVIKHVTRLGGTWTLDLLNFVAGETLYENDQQRLYVWGEVHYRDAFGFRRYVKFRMMTQGRDSGPVLGHDLEGNEAN